MARISIDIGIDLKLNQGIGIGIGIELFENQVLVLVLGIDLDKSGVLVLVLGIDPGPLEVLVLVLTFSKLVLLTSATYDPAQNSIFIRYSLHRISPIWNMGI